MPRWTVLGRFKAKPLERFSQISFFLCPAIAISIEYIERINGSLHLGFNRHIANTLVPDELIVIYLIAVPYAIATKLYEIACPNEIQQHKTPEQFIEYGKPSDVILPEHVDNIAREIAELLSDQINVGEGLSSALDIKNLQAASLQALGEHASPANRWQALNRSAVLIRLPILLFYLISIFLSIILIAWTTPAHVFRLHPVTQIVDYFLGYDIF